MSFVLFFHIYYDVFIVSSDEYNRNKKSEDIINKCVRFLTNED